MLLEACHALHGIVDGCFSRQMLTIIAIDMIIVDSFINEGVDFLLTKGADCHGQACYLACQLALAISTILAALALSTLDTSIDSRFHSLKIEQS